MALIKCPECGRENVSDSAEVCPDCGYGIKVHMLKLKIEEDQKNYEKELQAKREAEKQEKERIYKERYDSIKMPRKPAISETLKILLPIFFAWALVIWWAIAAKSILVFLGVGIIVAIPSGFFIFLLYNLYSNYNLATRDFEAYKMKKMKERDNLEKNIKAQQMQAEMDQYKRMNGPKCPMCSSTNISRISTTSRAVSVAAVGMASGKIGKQYKCNNCKHMW